MREERQVAGKILEIIDKKVSLSRNIFLSEESWRAGALILSKTLKGTLQ
jgi:hypothetical protein